MLPFGAARIALSGPHVMVGSEVAQLIRQTFENRRGGHVVQHWKPGGLVCEISFEMGAAE